MRLNGGVWGFVGWSGGGVNTSKQATVGWGWREFFVVTFSFCPTITLLDTALHKSLLFRLPQNDAIAFAPILPLPWDEKRNDCLATTFLSISNLIFSYSNDHGIRKCFGGYWMHAHVAFGQVGGKPNL